MQEMIFVDTDIVLDLLAQREPYYGFAAALFTLADKGSVRLFVSTQSFNIIYNLMPGRNAAIMRDFKVLVTVAAVGDKILDLALNSAFPDFEDAIQYYAAIEQGVGMLLTRNLKDYKAAGIPVMTPEDYIKMKKAAPRKEGG